MPQLHLIPLLLCAPSLSLALGVSQPTESWKRASERKIPELGYYDPTQSGQKMQTIIPETFPMGLGEPINMIISGHSDPAVLIDSEVNGGLRDYFLSLGFSGSCLGQHSGTFQAADLADGNGKRNETAVIRWNYGDPQFGTCKETIQGGNHFRYWVQNGDQANSGAVFMAASYELPIAQGHDIIIDGYNIGRDEIVGNITNQAIKIRELTNTTEHTGTTESPSGWTYQTDIKYVGGMASNSSEGINHLHTVGVNGVPAIDGLVAVMLVKIVKRPVASSSQPVIATGWYLLPTMSLVLALSLSMLSL